MTDCDGQIGVSYGRGYALLTPLSARLLADTGGCIVGDGVAVPMFRSPEVAASLRLSRSAAGLHGFFRALEAEKHQDHLHLENPNVELFQHQRQGVGYLFSCLESMGYVALHDEQGLGKTATAITLADFGRGLWGLKNVLVLCPSYLVRQWAREILRFSTNDVLAIPGDVTPRKKEKLCAFPFGLICRIDIEKLAWYHGQPYFVVAGYESLLNHTVAGALSGEWDLVVLDEATYVYNHEAKRGRAVRALLQRCKRRIVMTGTPVMNRPTDVWAEWDLLSGLAPSYEWFLDRYCFVKRKTVQSTVHTDRYGNPREYQIPIVVGFSKPRVAELASAVERYSIRRRRSQVTDLPEIQYHIIRIPLSPQQRAVYNKLADEGIAHVGDSTIECKGDLDRLTYMRMAADGLLHWGQNHSSKLDAAVQTLAESVGTPALILCPWKSLAEGVHKAIIKQGNRAGLCIGGKSTAARDTIVTGFMSGALDSIVATIDAVQFGLNLQRAEHVLLLGLHYNPKKMEQAIDRAHRIGGGSTLVTVFLAEDTVEEDIFNRVIGRKTDLIQAMRLAGDIEGMMRSDPNRFIKQSAGRRASR